MTQHDTSEAVAAFASLLDIREDQRVMDPTIAAMLRRLHTRAVEAERERDGLKTALAAMMGEAQKAQAALATARADALQEALTCCKQAEAGALMWYTVAESVGANMAANRISALIAKEN